MSPSTAPGPIPPPRKLLGDGRVAGDAVVEVRRREPGAEQRRGVEAQDVAVRRRSGRGRRPGHRSRRPSRWALPSVKNRPSWQVAQATGCAGGELARRVDHRAGCAEQRLAPLARTGSKSAPGRAAGARTVPSMNSTRASSSRFVGSREECISSGETMAPRAWSWRVGVAPVPPEGGRAGHAEQRRVWRRPSSRSRTGPTRCVRLSDNPGAAWQVAQDRNCR